MSVQISHMARTKKATSAYYVCRIADMMTSKDELHLIRVHTECLIMNDVQRTKAYIDGLVQERRNSSANALELRLSYTNPSIWTQSGTHYDPSFSLCIANGFSELSP